MSTDPKGRGPEDLSIPEKIHLVQDLWDEIARSPGNVELTPEQREEAERRLLEHERHRKANSSWEEIKRRLESGQ